MTLSHQPLSLLARPTSPTSIALSPPSSLPSSPRHVTASAPSTFTSHFVQALHDFFPNNAPSDNVSCLFFRRGAIIEVLNRDESGWWDGQHDGCRGWFPSNYVGVIGEASRHSIDYEEDGSKDVLQFEHWRQHMAQLSGEEITPSSMSGWDSKISQSVSESPTVQGHGPLTQTLIHGHPSSTTKDPAASIESTDPSHLLEDVAKEIALLVDACSTGDPSNIKLCNFQVISAVRSVLASAHAVNKDSPVLKAFPELARQRKVVLGALSKLVLKGKDLQADDSHIDKMIEQVCSLAHQLLSEMNTFETIAQTVPSHHHHPHDETTDITGSTTEQQHQQQQDDVSPRVSMMSFTSSASVSTTSLRQQLLDARLSSASLIAKAVPLCDAQHILQTILDHQHTIDTLMQGLLHTIEHFIGSRHRATDMLEMTRKAVEAVRTFLAVVEHVCSNIGELDYKHCSIIPEDPHLVALVLAKEAVYSAITNLVTAVRALAGPRDMQTPDDCEQLRISCENVVRTTHECAACVKTCLHVDPAETGDMQDDVRAMRDKLQDSVDTRRHQTLSILGRKVTSLNVLQSQYDDDATSSSDSSTSSMSPQDEISLNNKSSSSSSVSHSHLPPSRVTHADDDVDENQPLATLAGKHHSRPTEKDVEKLEIGHYSPGRNDDSDASKPPFSTLYSHQEDVFAEQQQDDNDDHDDVDDDHDEEEMGSCQGEPVAERQRIRSSPSETHPPRTSRKDRPTSKSSRHKLSRSETVRRSSTTAARSSVESINVTPMSTPESMSPVKECDGDNPIGSLPPCLPHRGSVHAITARPRASSINALQSASNGTFPLPPSPHPHPAGTRDLRLSVSKSTPTVDPALSKPRRSRGMSVSTLRMTLTKQKGEEPPSLHHISNETLIDPPSLRRMSSWMSMEVTERQDPLSIKEPEPWFLKERAFSEDEMMYNGEGQVTGATLEALIIKLTSHEKSPDLIFTRAFFYNFRLFTDPSTLLQLLIDRFRLSPPVEPELTTEESKLWTQRVLLPVRLRVCNVLKMWLEVYFSFEQDAHIEQTLIHFAANEMAQAMPGPSKRMLELIRRTFSLRSLAPAGRKHSYTQDVRAMMQRSATGSHASISSGSYIFSLFEDHHSTDSLTERHPQPNINRSLRNTLRKALSQNALSQVNVNDFDPLELARQLTLMENSLFCQIEPYEMIGQEFTKQADSSRSIHVKAMIQRSNQVTGWVSDSVLRESDPKKRAQAIKFWIKVADHCLQLSNYNTLMAIRSALDSTSIARLKKTWDHISAKYKAMIDPIYRATDSQRNFAEYRNRLKNAMAPCLPFLGIYLTDITFIDDGNGNYRTSPNGHQLINFDKYIKTTRVLNEIDQFQIPYKLIEVDEIQRFLVRYLETIETDNLVYYTRSLKVEPREEEFDIRSAISNLS
ncbi:uncharacterized protein BYT42DRAFT_562259 [Radiomyces spectabilis]|uniref:uncharacterized protein n=1 Tax=Radiomyces spectabilis TaxID=64574 RepID=UPI002220EDB1|nr:uncharacterized protein BYT42DRAFT_562259 [Radiomyces spectabilis]KAI8384366.1 hypothetical protein BYT42DRAFT_562259 [Radiomyces spectabilis]